MRLFLVISLILSTLSFASDKPLSTIGLGSCSNQWIPMPAFKEIIKHKPELMVMMGDNVYSDYFPKEGDLKHEKEWEENPFRNRDPFKEGAEPDDSKEMIAFFHKMYKMLSDDEGFKALRKTTPFIATWDDHDYGRNDVLADFRYKEQSRKIFLEFWGEPENTPRWTQKGGIYTSYMYGPKGKRIQVIMLDTRFNRTPQYKIEKKAFKDRYAKFNQGDYLVNPGYEANMLGDEQWSWLEDELKKDADLRIIVSSIQVLAEFNGWEAWSLFPTERERLYQLIDTTGAEGVILASGDVHYGEIVKKERCGKYPLWEITSSGINQGWPKIPANNVRVGDYYDKPNFGFIKVDWEVKDPKITFEIYSEDNKLVRSESVTLSSLKK
ncbi:MAG: alkaline phosphatase family protein [Epsilonproteobacteria bacterium]|nr:alkaline phosphatase family protein [Campylobacterota bacterium]